MRVALLSSALALVAIAGCRPTLRDGAYRCTDGVSCPPDWHCGSDGFCHLAPLSDAGPSTDRGTMPMGCGACSGTPDCVADAYCAPICAPGACPADGRVCSSGHCLFSCTSSATCPTGTRCAVGEWMPGTPLGGACVDDARLAPGTHGAACPATTCLPPDSCVGGACMRPCAMGSGVGCENGEMCLPAPPDVTLPAGNGVCLRNGCPDVPCMGSNFMCVDPPSDGTNDPPPFCWPVGWPSPPPPA